ncbi:MAG TPA: phage holin [Thermoanaerobacterium sp.]|nr:phage holin [Thermoanaerobacterium sp.]
MKELVMTILTAGVQLAVMAALGYAINFINAKIGTENTKKYYNLAKTVVTAIEQQIGPGKGPDKKSEAIAVIKELTKNKLSDEEINVLIEAAVKEMNLVLKQQKLEQ